MSNEELVTAIQAGGRDLTEQLVAQNRGMVFLTARRYYPAAVRNRGCDYNDLVQSASAGLIEAIDAWQQERGAFITLAVFYMRRACRKLLGISTAKQRIENTAPPVSIYEAAYQSNDGDPIQIVDTLIDHNATDPCEAAAESDTLTARIVQEATASLPERERDLIVRHVMNREPFRSCAASLGISVEACRSAENKALRVLRKNKRLLELRLDYVAACGHHKGAMSFQSSWTSEVEDAVIRREQLLARINETIAACSGFDTAELEKLRDTLLAGSTSRI